MGYIQVLPEYGLVADPMVGLVTTAGGASLGQVVERVDKLDKVADDIVNMLSGEGDFMVSFPPGRGEACFMRVVSQQCGMVLRSDFSSRG